MTKDIYVLSGDLETDKRSITKLLYEWPVLTLSFKENPSTYMITENVAEIISTIRDNINGQDIFKRVSFKDVSDEMKTVISVAIDEVFGI